jgi:hypothetical protein
MQAVEVRAESMKAMIPEETLEIARQALKVRVERMEAMETMETMKPMQAMRNDRTKEAQEIREDRPPSDEERDGAECKYQ